MASQNKGSMNKPIHIKSGVDRRLRNGYRWIFSNEIADPIKSFEAGETVEVVDVNGYVVGTGLVNPHALIAVRLLADGSVPIDRNFFRTAILTAASRRHRWYPGETCVRLVFGESDGLPGLVIDRYENHYVIQSFTIGIDRHLKDISEVLRELYSPDSIVFRQDSLIRKLEDLPLEKSVPYGSCPPEVSATIHGMTYRLNLLDGQKTGFFLDQRENHLLMRTYAKGKKVLDCFSYVGAWALHAAQSGANSVRGLDSSASAIEACTHHVSLNGLDNCTFDQADVFDELKAINDRRESYDVIVLDPPAFAKSKSQVRDAVKGYREINRRAAKALAPGGLLISCSCSHVIDQETFRNTVFQGVASAGRSALLLEQHGQAKDHPVLMSMRETEYLKCLVMEINP